MAEYYAVERSSEYLAHYGVRGMKWGVRKAIERGNNARLSRHAMKAAVKLARLKQKADIVGNAQEYRSYKQLTRSGLGVAGLGAAGGLLAYGTGHLNRRVAEPLGAITGAGLGMAGAAGARALVRRNRLSSKGHAKAVKNVRDWQKSMNETFKGTKYAKIAGKKYDDKYAIDKAVFNPRTGKVSRKRIAVFRGEQLTRDYTGDRTPKMLNSRHKAKRK